MSERRMLDTKAAAEPVHVPPMTLEEAARRLNVRTIVLRRLANLGEISHYNLEGAIMFAEEHLRDGIRKIEEASRRFGNKKARPNAEYEVPRARGKHRCTKERFDELLAEQDGKCAICGRSPERLFVDHDHTTSLVRALLCRYCNSGLGFFGDDPHRLRAAAQYLETRGK